MRDQCGSTLLGMVEKFREEGPDAMRSGDEINRSLQAKEEHRLLQQSLGYDPAADRPRPLRETSGDENFPLVYDSTPFSIIQFTPTKPLRITCLTIGSRGDVQPYIALCKGLLEEGHAVKIATHKEFQGWIEKHGIEFADVTGDPAELMRICTQYGMFTYSFLKEASSKLRGWIDSLLDTEWQACQDTDILIESPSAMGGIHIAEALGIPYFRAFTMPWTRTRAYPHAFFVPQHHMGGSYNYYTYVMFDNLFWKATSGQINKWRNKQLHLPPTNLEKLEMHKVPFLYNFSPIIVPPPLDFADWVKITGYWTLDEGGDDFKPPEDLVCFIKQARDDGKKLVYIGFGSIVVSDAKALTKSVVDSVLRSDVRCILSKGWSDRGDKAQEGQHKEDADTEGGVAIPSEVHLVDAVPHDWLFKQVDAAVHHGGAGTTGASLRAGIPTIIKPFFGDQFFFALRVEDLGVGLYLRRLNISQLSKALWAATRNERIIRKARFIGEQISCENGVHTAINAIYRDLEYAKSLIKHNPASNVTHARDDSEESWSMVEDEERDILSNDDE